MSTPLFSTNQLASIRALAEMGMQSDVQILKRTTVETADGTMDVFANGDLVKGWVYSTPTPTITIVAGAQALVNTYRLFVPVGTDIESGDRVDVEGHRFIVSDTTHESTWLPLLNVSLRRVE